MLSEAENELITRTGAGTPLGEVFRRFWIPAVLASEIPEPDCPPVKVTLLGEKLIAFRTTDGTPVLMDERCPHRHANLFWGRNEDNCIRCVYHGWQFAADGSCTDIPAEPDNSKFKEHVSVTSYATHECAGVVWTYMGPKDNVPPFPDFDFGAVPESHTLCGKRRVPCNYLQNLEGELDTAHVQFLHNEFGELGEGIIKPAHKLKTRFLLASTNFGLVVAARRDYPDEVNYWRMTPFMLPSFTIIPSVPDLKHLTAAVPLDDENMWGFTISWRPDRPMDDADRELFYSGREQQIEVDPKTFLGKYNVDNDYGIDRELQKTSSFTGIPGVRLQDCAVQEDQGGPVMQRSQEHLGTTDRAIVATRRRLINLAREMEAGNEPEEPFHPEAFRVRSIVAEAPSSVPWQDVWREAQPEGAPVDLASAD